MKSKCAQYSFRLLTTLVAVGLLTACGIANTNSGGARSALHRDSTSCMEQLETFTTNIGGYSADEGEAITFLNDSSDFQDCDWRKCEISEGPLRCAQSGHICDMYRNMCLPICIDGHCCDSVKCPEGTVCVPSLGCCGIPAGEDCYDLGTDWWSGRDIRSKLTAVLVEPVPAVVKMRNDGEAAVYLVSTLEYEIRFDLYMTHCGQMRKLPLAVNHFCPTLCPEEGPPIEIDCGPSSPIMQRLPPGEQMIIHWSGLEQVGMWRICGASSVRYCMVDRVTLPGVYTLEICAYTDVDGGYPDANAPNRLIMAKPAGERRCLRVEFHHPTTTPIVIRFDS
jgi:hypothetical protein